MRKCTLASVLFGALIVTVVSIFIWSGYTSYRSDVDRCEAIAANATGLRLVIDQLMIDVQLRDDLNPDQKAILLSNYRQAKPMPMGCT